MNVNTKNFDENRYINFARASGIIMVVVGHSESPITSIIYLFHMSLFFFISGYLYKDKYSNDIKLQIIKKVKSLYIPFIKYQIAFLLLHNLFFYTKIYTSYYGISKFSGLDYLKGFINIILFGGNDQLLGGFWFLTAMFEVTVIYALICYFSLKVNLNSQYIRNVLVFTLFIIGNILIYFGIKLPRFLDTAIILIVIYHIGYLYKKYERIIPMNIYFFVVSLLSILTLNKFGSINVGRNEYTNPIYFIICSLLGIYIVFYISKHLNRRFRLNLLNFIGQNTLHIFALHFLSFKIVSLIIVKIYHYPIHDISMFPVISGQGINWLVYSFIGVLVPTLIKYVYDKIYAQLRLNKNA